MESADPGNFTAARARALTSAAFRALEERKAEINDLNVYPVPDGDTGTNLSLTVKSVLQELLSLPDDLPAEDLADRISTAALMGARGNSGVILSQMIRGAMEVLSQRDRVDDETIAAVLQQASDSAYRAIRKPVEGTMLTVLREMAEAAEEAVSWQEHPAFAEHLLHSGWDSVRRTPTLLKTLADAGVVDAGGYGLVVILEGLFAGAEGTELTRLHTADPRAIASREELGDHEMYEDEESDYRYCTSFLLRGEDLDSTFIEAALLELGDSLLVVGDPEQLKVHIHTDEPGQVLSLATSRGALYGVEIDNMKEQTAARTERLRERQSQAGLTQVLAVVSGEGNKRLFASLGADLIVDGGQSMNPSAEDLLQCIRRAIAPAVIILPNNGNIILTAEQIVGLEEEREVLVVPTRSMQAGLSALVAFDRALPGEENAAAMGEAVEGISTGEVTWAVRDSCIDGFRIKQGSYIGLVDERVVAAEDEFRRVVEAVAARLVGDQREVLTLLVGDTRLADEAREIAEELRRRYEDVDIEVHEGGQPLYPLLLAAE